MKYAMTSAIIAAFLPFCALADDAPAAAPAAAPAPISNPTAIIRRGDFAATLKEVLTNNPDIIMDAIHSYRDKQQAQADVDSKVAMDKHRETLFTDKVSPSAGNPKADVTIVEFFDYHCGYCKAMLPTISKLLQDDKNVRVIFREFPILSEDSVVAARAALGVNAINSKKYFDYHTALMKNAGKFDEETVLKIAQSVGVDPDALKKAMASPAITKMLDDNRGIAQDLGIHGTPTILLGSQIMPGAVPYDQLKKYIDDQRKAKKDS